MIWHYIIGGIGVFVITCMVAIQVASYGWPHHPVKAWLVIYGSAGILIGIVECFKFC